MDPREIALFSRMFHLPAEIIITSVDPSPTELVMGVACQAPRMECHQPSARIHGSYQRTVADLPCAGRNVILALTVALPHKNLPLSASSISFPPILSWSLLQDRIFAYQPWSRRGTWPSLE